jgi:DNA-directed RNA polymerase subunit E'
VNDQVRAKIIAVSLGTGRSGKLGLTMRQKFLGKEEWIEVDIEDAYADEEKPVEPNEVEDSTD